MSDEKKDPPSLQKDPARKFERRRSNRPKIAPLKEAAKEEVIDDVIFRLRPEAAVIALMVIALLVLAAIAI